MHMTYPTPYIVSLHHLIFWVMDSVRVRVKVSESVRVSVRV